MCCQSWRCLFCNGLTRIEGNGRHHGGDPDAIARRARLGASALCAAMVRCAGRRRPGGHAATGSPAEVARQPRGLDVFRRTQSGAQCLALGPAASRREVEAASRREPWFVRTEDDRLDAAAATHALASLPDAERETIVARLWGGLSWDEIARLIGASPSSVQRWYQQGLAGLRERLGETWQKNKTGSMT